jgi:hypothetical protein
MGIDMSFQGIFHGFHIHNIHRKGQSAVMKRIGQVGAQGKREGFRRFHRQIQIRIGAVFTRGATAKNPNLGMMGKMG